VQKWDRHHENSIEKKQSIFPVRGQLKPFFNQVQDAFEILQFFHSFSTYNLFFEAFPMHDFILMTLMIFSFSFAIKTILTLWITYFPFFAIFQDLITSLFFPFDIGRMKAVLHSLDLLCFQYAAFSYFFHKYLLRYHPKLISFAFLSKQEPKI